MIENVIKKGALASLAVATTLFAACGPAPTSPTNIDVKKADLKAVAVSEITPENDISSSISLGWSGLPAEAVDVKIFRSRGDGGTAELISTQPSSKTTLSDNDNRLSAGVDYVYNLRADNNNAATVATAESEPIQIINAESITPFKLTTPSANQEILQNLGGGIEFKWEDAGTGLYHVMVSDLSGTPLWGSITTGTSLKFGTPSGRVNNTTSAKLVVPLALTQKLIISSDSPNAARNEIQQRGIGNTSQYRIQVSAIETSPNKGDLASAKSIAIRQAEELRFIAQ